MTTCKIGFETYIEIKNKEGRTVRALKTNKLGQFSIAQSLPNDQYFLLAENGILLFESNTASRSFMSTTRIDTADILP